VNALLRRRQVSAISLEPELVELGPIELDLADQPSTEIWSAPMFFRESGSRKVKKRMRDLRQTNERDLSLQVGVL
jgi:hypothetical protein